MLKKFMVLVLATGAGWLIHTFGFGMLIALAALAAAALFFAEPAKRTDA